MGGFHQVAEFDIFVVGVAVMRHRERRGERAGRLDGADGAEGGESGGGRAAEVALGGLGVERGWGRGEIEAA